MASVVMATRNWLPVSRVDRVWIAIGLILALLAVVDLNQVRPTIVFTIDAILHTGPFIVLAVLAIGFLRATGSETVVASAFRGNEKIMIVLASMVGGVSPFCSCEVIPFISALLIAGTPLSAVMAFWLASPIMDPAVFFITSAELGWGFAMAKTVIAISLGLFAGFAIHFTTQAGYFSDVLLAKQNVTCCSSSDPLSGKPVWKFWKHSGRLQIFRSEATYNALFLLKWLSLAYLIESLMIVYVPATLIASMVGGEGVQPIIVSALVGAPAYLNGYAAPAIVSTLMEQGMGAGSAMSFMVAGGITSIPAMTAVYALVKKRLFFTYLSLGITGSIISGLGFQVYIHIIS